MYISEISGIFYGHIQCVRTNFIIAAANALGIGAASFASHAGRGTGTGTGNGKWEWGGDGASKDIAESPTACRNAQGQFIIHNA